MHEKLKHKSVSIVVISLGYIGSPLGLKDDIASSSWLTPWFFEGVVLFIIKALG